MDPLSIATTVITVGTFVKDVLELARKIESSILQVRSCSIFHS